MAIDTPTWIELNDLLRKAGVDPATTIVMRHRPREKSLREVLPWLAAEREALYNAYQCKHGVKVEGALQKAAYVVSLIGHEPGRALFVGIFRVAGFRWITRAVFLSMPVNRELIALGMDDATDEDILWFDLQPTDVMSSWKGRLVLGWPGKELSWWRWSERNAIPVETIHEESALVRRLPRWQGMVLRWDELRVLPRSWREALSQWRGIYYIFDTHAGKGYVGSAAGAENLLGRWLDYARSGHGGNKLLRACRPEGLEFSILQRVSPDTEVAEVVALEADWKQRLHSRTPHGLNEN